ncbi:MAG TPA: hypothetical protein VGM87_18010 [Roseomonas sp.]
MPALLAIRRPGRVRPGRAAARCATVAILVIGLLGAGGARAGLADFLDHCMATVADFGQLPAGLAAAGYAEADPATGPHAPTIAPTETGRHLWLRLNPEQQPGDYYTGLTAATPDRPFEICWHISRPGESAAEALPILRQRFPPIEGTTETGTVVFYAGDEHWLAQVGAEVVIIGVIWPMEGVPAQGVGEFYVVRPQVLIPD